MLLADGHCGDPASSSSGPAATSSRLLTCEPAVCQDASVLTKEGDSLTVFPSLSLQGLVHWASPDAPGHVPLGTGN